jgi:hypothetical protein
MHTKSIKLLVVVFLITLNIQAENLVKLVNLEGTWKFTIGDNPAWASVEYDDRGWDYIRVPDSWEQSGFNDYDGYAWYRRSFSLNMEINDEYLFLLVGYIDDVDEVYVNGHLVGSMGKFPPLVRTAYNILRKYPIPVEILNQHGKNTVAVRVFDDYYEGGIRRGPVGLFYDNDNHYLNQNLAGYWDFETKNNYKVESKSVYGNQPGKIFVPSNWESQGYQDYDGNATYTKYFKLNNSLINENKLVMVLGYIDDIDKVYLNGHEIGSVYAINKSGNEGTYYQTFRGYEIPDEVLNRNGENILIIKVYDNYGFGGIYEGPVGIATESNFKILKSKQKVKTENNWYDIFKSFWE